MEKQELANIASIIALIFLGAKIRYIFIIGSEFFA